MAISRHGGNMRALAEAAGRPMDEILDFSANINPLGPPGWLRPLISSHVSSLVHYPDPDCSLLVEAASARYGVCADEVLVGNGSSEILHVLPRALGAVEAVIPVPAYADYATAADLAGLPVRKIHMTAENGFSLDFSALHPLPKGSLVFIGRPNNPTGSICDAEELRSLASRNPDSCFFIDEAFADFVEGMDRMIFGRPPNMIVLCSLTKSYAIPGLRLGLAVANRDIAQKVRGLLPPWSVNTLAQAVGERALRDEEYLIRTRKYVEKQREYLARELGKIPGLVLYPGKANFLLLRILRDDMKAPELAQRLLREGMAIRVCDNFEGLDARFFRIAVRREEENARLCRSLRAALGEAPGVAQGRKPALMFCGTSSNAGKSLLTAAFCRILLQDGYRVAPFKSQNMALNSYVTRDGGEMGRAQVVQAQACRVDPDVRMNPILLKPVSDIGAQVIVRGEPRGNMDVEQYIRFKPEAFAEARRAYDSLAGEYDVIVLEGAGSPAEVNLKHHDIVNLAMARHARAPVLIVGDIDRGGVFASFVGTLEVLEEWERALVKGLVINRFRGRRELLDDAVSYVQNHTGLPVLGVVPFLSGHGLPEEDSVGFKSGLYDDHHSKEDGVEIGVIDLPHISNFTDFDPLRIEPDVTLKIIRSPQDINRPDAVILPGSKSVADDLAYLRNTGLASKLMDLPAAGAEVIGICGGFQMLGDEIADPHRIESCGETVQGLGLLPIRTFLESGKTLDRVTGKHLESGLPVRGYEIHHGRTTTLDPFIRRDDGEVIGTGLKSGKIWGTYLHGLFDEDRFRRWFLDRLRTRRGMPALGKIRAVYDLEPALERLARSVRENVQIERIYRLMRL